MKALMISAMLFAPDRFNGFYHLNDVASVQCPQAVVIMNDNDRITVSDANKRVFMVLQDGNHRRKTSNYEYATASENRIENLSISYFEIKRTKIEKVNSSLKLSIRNSIENDKGQKTKDVHFECQYLKGAL